MKNHKLLQIAVFSIPILILLFLASPPAFTSMFGEEIKLRTKPIDPTDLFRGSYVALGYDIEEVQTGQLDSAVQSEMDVRDSGDKIRVHALLKEETGGIYAVDKVVMDKPDSGIYITGELRVPYRFDPSRAYRIEYGLENYFAPSKKAIDLEKHASEKPAVSLVKVRNGHAILVDVLIE